MNIDKNTNGSVEVSIQELRLRPSTELMISDKAGRPLKHKGQFVAAFGEKSVLVALLVDSPKKIEMRVGESYLFNGFTGKYDFSFTAGVMQIDDMQFTARLSNPDSVSVKFVRGHLRARLAAPVSISVSGQDQPTSAIIKEFSVAGASIDSNESFGNVGDKVSLAFQVEFENKKVNLNLASAIRHIHDSGNGSKYRIGVEFLNASQNDKLMLYYYAVALSEAADVL